MSLRRVAIVLLSSMLGVTAQQAPAPGAGEAEFDTGLAAVHALMQKAKWPEARTALLDLVRAQQNKVYAQAQCDSIAADLRTCAFFASAKVPKVTDLITGKIASFDERTGRIKVVYSDSFTDWKGEGETLKVNPLVFAGAYSITVTGNYPTGHQSFSLCFDLDPMGDGYFLADFGFAPQAHGRSEVSLAARIMHAKGEDEPREIASDRSPARPDKPFTAVVRVSDDRVEMTLDNKPVLKTKRAKTEFGQVGIWDPKQVRDVVLEGRIEPSCLQSRVDEELDKQRGAFEEKFDPKKELPAWLFERPDVRRTPALYSSWLPGRGSLSNRFDAMIKLVVEGKLAEGAAALKKLDETDAARETLSFLEAVLHVRLGRPELAEPICTRLLADDAQMSQARLLRATALDAMGRSAEAIAELETVRTNDPGNEAVYEQLCVTLLRKGRTDDARRVVREAKMRHGLWDEMAQLERMLMMASRGPNWPRRFSHQSPHYDVCSDIDRKVCVDACSILEASYVNLMSQLAWIKEDKSQPRFRVFLFSGESGYQEYNKAIVGDTVPHSAGLYTPVLKQLLIWNLPKRDDMVRTIRHEGFHQFLDRIMDNPPTWLNEGTAEFWETAARQDGRMQGGQVRPDHLATLARSRKALPKLKDFVYGGRADFYAFAQQRYAHAWALVHFLRKGPGLYTARFDKLWGELRTAKSTSAALDAAFAGVDWDKLEQDFWTHVASLK